MGALAVVCMGALAVICMGALAVVCMGALAVICTRMGALAVIPGMEGGGDVGGSRLTRLEDGIDTYYSTSSYCVRVVLYSCTVDCSYLQYSCTQYSTSGVRAVVCCAQFLARGF